MKFQGLMAALLGVAGLVATIVGGAPPASAEPRSIEIAVSDDAARATFTMPLGRTDLDFDLGALHHKDNGTALHAGLYVVGFAGRGTSTLELAIGGRVLVADTDVDDGSGIALGARARYHLPKLERMTLGAHLFYAPDITSFGDTDDILDVGGSVGYFVLENAELFLEATTLRVDFERRGAVTVDNGLRIGFRARF